MTAVMSKNQMRKKAVDLQVTPAFLQVRTKAVEAMGFKKQKWVMFCEVMMKHGLTMSIYEAVKTRSKYITVKKGKQRFKVRFSNHAPIEARELRGDCDFFVGRTHTGIRTTDQAIKATLEFFNTNNVANIGK